MRRKQRIKPFEIRLRKMKNQYQIIFYDGNHKRHLIRSGTLNAAEAVRIGEERIKGLEAYRISDMPTLSEAFQRMFTEEWQFLKDYKGKRWHCNEIVARIGDIPIDSITTPVILNLITELQMLGNKNGTINRKLAVIKRMLNVAKTEWLLLDTTPHIKTMKEVKGGHREFITDEQLDVILMSVEKERYRRLITFLAFTGMRPSEALRLTWADLDFENRIVTLRDTKNGESWITPLVDEAVSALSEFEGNLNAPVWPYCNQKQLRIQWDIGRAVLDKEDNPKFTPYALRHTFARNMLRKGFSTAQVKAWLHHKTLVTTESYTQLEDWELMEIRDKLNSLKS